MGPMGPLGPIPGPQSFMELASQGFPPLPPPIPLPGMNDSPLEFSTSKNQPPVVRESTEDNNERRDDKNDSRKERDSSRRLLSFFTVIGVQHYHQHWSGYLGI